jgi:hypothetical protein
LRALAETCSDRVLEDVLGCCGQVLVALDDPGGESLAEEVAAPLVPAVERLGVDAVEALHAVG